MLEYYRYAADSEAVIMPKMVQDTYGEAYEWIKEANKRVHALGEYVLKYDWVNTKTSLGTDKVDEHNRSAFATVEKFQPESFKELKAFSSTADAIVSEFVDADGKMAYMAVNYTEPTSATVNTVTFTFEGKTKAIAVKEGQRQDLALEDGKLEIVLNAGEGVFVIAE
jgi:hypothetical protein